MHFSVGYFHFLSILRFEARHEIKSRIEKDIPENELCRIIFQPGDKIDWVRENKEFLLDDHLYDVVTCTENNGTRIFYCIDDKQESRVMAAMEKHFHDSMQNGGSSTNAYRVLVSFYPVLIEPGFAGIVIPSGLIIDLRSFCSIKILDGFPDISTPPPVSC